MSLADQIKNRGFVPEPHAMDEGDMVKILGGLVDHPVESKDKYDDKYGGEVRVTKRAIDLNGNLNSFAEDVRPAVKGLGQSSAVTLLYPVKNGNHYEFLRVRVASTREFTMVLESSQPNPGTRTTPTHAAFERVKSELKKIAEAESKHSKLETELKFTDQQQFDDAMRSSLYAIQRIVREGAPTTDIRYDNISKAKSSDDLKLAVTQFLVRGHTDLGKAVAAELKVDPVTHVVYRTALTSEQETKLDSYKIAYIEKKLLPDSRNDLEQIDLARAAYDTMAKSFDALLEQSNASVKAAREQAFKDTSVEACVAKAKSDYEKDLLRHGIQMKFDGVGDKQARDEKLAYILQTQELLRFFRSAKSVDHEQIKSDAQIARKPEY